MLSRELRYRCFGGPLHNWQEVRAALREHVRFYGKDRAVLRRLLDALFRQRNAMAERMAMLEERVEALERIVSGVTH